MILGALAGFLIAAVVGWLTRCEWPELLWRASSAALVGGVLLRWWHGVWMRNWQQVLLEKYREMEAASAESKSPVKKS